MGKEDVRELIDHLDLTKKGDWHYYNDIKRELSWMCGEMSVGERVDFDLFNKSITQLVNTMEL